MTNLCRGGVVAFVLLFASPALAQPSIAGRIKTVSGTAFIVRQNTTIPAQAGQPLFEADRLRTGVDGRLGVTLKDETRLSLGPNTDIHLDRFVYVPSKWRLGFTLRIARGIVGYVSGRIAKLSPDSVRLETPSAIVGVRGTHLAIRVEAP